MLADIKAFEQVETFIKENGTLLKFEAKNGEVQGRMMITLGTVPEDLDIAIHNGDYVFIGSFDFYDTQVGIAINPATKKVASGLWFTQQVLEADQPTDEWINFFISKLIDSFSEDGSFGTPICSFITNTTDMTIVPTVE